jgi:hypothetical protein
MVLVLSLKKYRPHPMIWWDFLNGRYICLMDTPVFALIGAFILEKSNFCASNLS